MKQIFKNKKEYLMFKFNNPIFMSINIMYSSKFIIMFFTLFIALSVTSSAQVITSAPPAPCSDLFISEITLGKEIDINGNWQLNYAVEIYNSSNQAINLNNYSLVLKNYINNTTVQIPITGAIINSNDVFVVTNTTSNLSLLALADHSSIDLRFDNYMTLELMKGGIVLDQVGEPISGSTFDFTQFANDPYTYLQNYDLNLDDYNNITLRRLYTVKQGKPNFEALDLLYFWRVIFNIEESDIGSHLCTCNKPLNSPFVQLDYAFKYLDCSSSDPTAQAAGFKVLVDDPVFAATIPTGCKYDFVVEGGTGAGSTWGPGMNNDLFFFDAQTSTTEPSNFFIKSDQLNTEYNGTVNINMQKVGFFNIPPTVQIQLVSVAPNSNNASSCPILGMNTTNGINYGTFPTKNCKGPISISNILYVGHELNIFPNPANTFIKIPTSEEFDSYILYNSQGSIIKANKMKSNTIIDISTLERGNYFIKIISKANKIYNSKFVIN